MLNILIVEVPLESSATLKAGSTTELNQQLQALWDAGGADLVRLHLRSLENLPAFAQFGESVPIITSRQRFTPRSQPADPASDTAAVEPMPVEFISGIRNDHIGTLFRSTARVEASGSIVAELMVAQTRFITPSKAGDVSSDLSAADKANLQNQATVRIPAGQTLVLARQESTVAGKSMVTIVLLSGSHE